MEASIENMTPEGRGVARIEGKTVFVDGSLPGERVRFRYTRRHRRFDEAVVEDVIEASPDRVTPHCVHFDVCGGCALQHLDSAAQVGMKQQTLLEDLRRIGNVEPETLLEPVTGPVWAYRRKARLGVKHVPKKGGVLVGFRERGTPYLAMLESCPVLHPGVGERIRLLRDLLGGMQARDRIPQIEVAVDDDDRVALVFRNLETLSRADREALTGFAREQDVQVWLQPGSPETLTPLWPEEPEPLVQAHPSLGTRVHFSPLDFFQVNTPINRAMVPRALDLLEVPADAHVLDLFCGLGNFTLPLARRAARVTGVEGDAGMVRRAMASARLNGIENTDYHAADLSANCGDAPWLKQRVDRVLLDPPRPGARELMPALGRLAVERMVYVSCNPATLARDAGELVHVHGYRLAAAGVMDMFPHTAHLESMAVFVKR